MVAKSDVFNIFHQFQALVERQFALKIKSVQTDWGGEYQKLNTYFKTIGIHHRVICPHIHEQNGMVERRHKHIVETGLTLLGQCHAPFKYWSYAFESSVYLINRMPTRVLNYKSPFECLLKSSPDYPFLQTFGFLCFPFLRPYNTHKLDFRSSACVFLGYSNSHLGYRCLGLSSKHIYLSRHVRFHEHVFPLGKSKQIAVPPINSTAATILVTLYHPKPSSPTLPPLPPTPPTSHLAPLPLSACYYHDQAIGTDSDSPPSHAVQVQLAPASSPAGSPILAVTPADSTAFSTPRPAHILSSSSGFSSDSSHGINLRVDLSKFQLQQIPASVDNNFSQPAHLHPMLLRPRPPKDANFSVVTSSRVATLPQQEPLSFKDANRYLVWHNAMQEEIRALHSNHTWSLVPSHPSMNVIGSRWVYKIKRHADGRIDQYKARLVARGFSQQEGIDYLEMFSPVVKPTTVRLVLTIAVSYGWNIYQLDVHNAFLNDIIQEEVYMAQPPGFANSAKSSYVCPLHKSLYGLKQAPRAWYNRLSEFLFSIGFQASKVDTSLFILSLNGAMIYLLVYVDDILLTGSNSALLHRLITLLQTEFKLRDLGYVHFFLGIEVKPTAMGLLLSQHKYALDIIQRAGMASCKPVDTPLSTSSKLGIVPGTLHSDPTRYRQIVGALQYLTFTRPDICYAINKVCQFMHASTDDHWAAVKRILRYL